MFGAQVNLVKGFKRSTARDFRINTAKLLEKTVAQEREQEERERDEAEDESQTQDIGAEEEEQEEEEEAEEEEDTAPAAHSKKRRRKLDDELAQEDEDEVEEEEGVSLWPADCRALSPPDLWAAGGQVLMMSQRARMTAGSFDRNAPEAMTMAKLGGTTSWHQARRLLRSPRTTTTLRKSSTPPKSESRRLLSIVVLVVVVVALPLSARHCAGGRARAVYPRVHRMQIFWSQLRLRLFRLELALKQRDGVELIRRGLVREVDDVHGESRRHAILWHLLREELGVALRVASA